MALISVFYLALLPRCRTVSIEAIAACSLCRGRRRRRKNERWRGFFDFQFQFFRISERRRRGKQRTRRQSSSNRASQTSACNDEEDEGGGGGLQGLQDQRGRGYHQHTLHHSSHRGLKMDSLVMRLWRVMVIILTWWTVPGVSSTVLRQVTVPRGMPASYSLYGIFSQNTPVLEIYLLKPTKIFHGMDGSFVPVPLPLSQIICQANTWARENMQNVFSEEKFVGRRHNMVRRRNMIISWPR